MLRKINVSLSLFVLFLLMMEYPLSKQRIFFVKGNKVSVKKYPVKLFLQSLKIVTMASLASINIRFNADLKGFSSQLQQVNNQLKNSGDNLKEVGKSLSTYITLPVIAAGGASIKLASDYEESLNKVNVAFGESAKYVDSFGDTALDTFGIAKGTALDMASLFGDMATSMGLPQVEAAKMSTSLVGLAGDLASFKNIGIAEATTALNGVFTGETESLKRLGVVMTQANLQQFAYSQGINKNIQELTEAEKVQLRYAFILDKTKNAQGDFARTSDGAANQTRVLTESLKQIGQQIGAILLPFFTKIVSVINDKIKAFSNLSEGTKKVIVVVAGLAAAIGPLLFGIGALVNTFPILVTGFTTVRTAFTTLTAVLAANPFGALIAALSLVVIGLYAYNKASSDAVLVTNTLNSVRAEAAKSVAKEKAELDTLLKIAKDESLSKKERENAIKKLNELSPKYLGNLKLETINTDEATRAITNYNIALNDRALAQAVLSKKTELFNQLIDLQEKGLNDTGNSFENASQSASNYIFSLFGVETQTIKNKKELEAYIKTSKLSNEQAKAARLAYEPLLKARQNDVDRIQIQIDALDKFNTKTSDSSTETDKLTTSINNLGNARDKFFNKGSIAFYENEISKLQKLQKESTLTQFAYLGLQKQIDEFQLKIDAISAPVISPLGEITSPSFDTEPLIESYFKNSTAYKEMVDRIESEDARLKAVQDAATEAQKVKAQELTEAWQMIGQSVVDLFGNMAQGFVDTLGIADEGMKGFVSSLIGTITKLISIALSASIANSIQGASQSALATGPGAIFAQPAFIATAVSGIIAAFASIPKFEFGGVVGGSSYTGDKILARVNSGELILNQKQQGVLSGLLDNSGQNLNIGIDGAFKLTGSDLELVIGRAIQKNSRKR